MFFVVRSMWVSLKKCHTLTKLKTVKKREKRDVRIAFVKCD